MSSTRPTHLLPTTSPPRRQRASSSDSAHRQSASDPTGCGLPHRRTPTPHESHESQVATCASDRWAVTRGFIPPFPPLPGLIVC